MASLDNMELKIGGFLFHLNCLLGLAEAPESLGDLSDLHWSDHLPEKFMSSQEFDHELGRKYCSHPQKPTGGRGQLANQLVSHKKGPSPTHGSRRDPTRDRVLFTGGAPSEAITNGPLRFNDSQHISIRAVRALVVFVWWEWQGDDAIKSTGSHEHTRTAG